MLGVYLSVSAGSPLNVDYSCCLLPPTTLAETLNLYVDERFKATTIDNGCLEECSNRSLLIHLGRSVVLPPPGEPTG